MKKLSAFGGCQSIIFTNDQSVYPPVISFPNGRTKRFAISSKAGMLISTMT